MTPYELTVRTIYLWIIEKGNYQDSEEAKKEAEKLADRLEEVGILF